MNATQKFSSRIKKEEILKASILDCIEIIKEEIEHAPADELDEVESRLVYLVNFLRPGGEDSI